MQMTKSCDVCEGKAEHHCKNCTRNRYYCKPCFDQAHLGNANRSNHQALPIDDDIDTIVENVICTLHPDKEKGYVCLNCDKTVCSDCIAFGDHIGHKMGNFKIGLEKLGEKFERHSNLSEDMKDLISSGKETIPNFIDSDIEKMKDLRKKTEDDLQKLLDLIKAKKVEIITTIDQEIDKKAEEKRSIGAAAEQLTSSIEKCEKILKASKEESKNVNVVDYDSFAAQYDRIKDLKSFLTKWCSPDAFKEKKYTPLPLESIRRQIQDIKVNDEFLGKSQAIFKNSLIIEDVKDQMLLQKWVSEASDNAEIKFQLLWKASIDGFRASIFHSKCDGKGPTVTIIKSDRDQVFGGYTSMPWKSAGEFGQDSKAFVYSLSHKTKHSNQKNNGHSVYHDNRFGPVFGSGFDICVVDNSNESGKSYSQGNETYELPSDASAQTYFAGAFKFKIKEIEVYGVLNINHH